MTWRYRAESGTYECLVKNCEINILVYVCVRANVSVDSRQYMVKACAYSCHHSVVLVLVASVNSVMISLTKTKTKMVKNEKVTNSLTKTKTKTKQ